MTTLSGSIQKKVNEEFKEVLRLLDWKHKGNDIFKRWYVDSKLFYHILIDENSPRKGITEVRYIDPKFIKKVRVIEKTSDRKTMGPANNVDLVKKKLDFRIQLGPGMFLECPGGSWSALMAS